MSQEVVEQRRPYLPEDMLQQILASLPAHIDPRRFERNLYMVLTQVRDIDRADPKDIMNEVMKIASLGLEMDPQLGEAYLIVAKGYKLQARVGYRGLMKLARQSGMIREFYAHEVYLNDHFVISLGDDKRIEHFPLTSGERGDYIGCYAVVKFADGGVESDWMPLADINKIRDKSDAYKAFAEQKIKSTPWDSDPIEMGKKTVIRRVSKRVPSAPDQAAFRMALDMEDRSENYVAGSSERPRSTLGDRFRGRQALPGGFSPVHAVSDQRQPAMDTRVQDTVQKETVPDGNGSPEQNSSAASPKQQDDRAGEVPNRLPRSTFVEFSQAIVRYNSTESLEKGGAKFWEDKGGAPQSGPDRELLVAIVQAHKSRISGDIDIINFAEHAEAIITKSLGDQ